MRINVVNRNNYFERLYCITWAEPANFNWGGGGSRGTERRDVDRYMGAGAYRFFGRGGRHA